MVDIYDYIKELAKIDVEFQSPNGKFYSLKSYIKRLDDDAILIDSPSDDGVTINLQIGQEIGIGVRTESGVLLGQSSVLGKELSTISGVLVSYPSSVQLVQRREYVRVPLNLETEITIIENNIEGKKRVEKVRLRDISGNGISYISENQITPYYDIKCKILMNDGEEPIYSPLEHIYSKKNSIHNDSKYIHAFVFTNLDNKSINRIVKACFKYQLELKKKGFAET